MSRTIVLSVLVLSAFLFPRPVEAYPNSAPQYTITVKDVSWTVLQDHRNPLRWYYLPAVVNLSEQGKRQPVLTVLKYQVPAPDNKQTLIGNTLLLLTLNLAPEKVVLDELVKAVAALKPMLDRKAAPGDISLESVQMSEAKASLFDGEGQIFAEAAAIESIGSGVSAAGISFYLKMEGETVDKVEKPLFTAGGVKISVDYAYTAGALKPGASRSGPAVLRGQASGAVSLGAYPKEVQDKSVMVFPYGAPQAAFFLLPAVSDITGIKEVRYTVNIMNPDGKDSKLVPAESIMWSAKGGMGWRDPRGNLRQTLLFPALALYDEAKAAGKDLAAFKYRVKGETGVTRGTMLDITKAEGDTAFLSGGVAFAAAYSPFRVVSVYGDFLTFIPQDSASDLAAVQLVLSCGKQKEAFTLKADKDGKLNMNPSTAFFDKACGSVSLQADYVQKGGKKSRKVFSDLVQGRDSAVYLENYTE